MQSSCAAPISCSLQFVRRSWLLLNEHHIERRTRRPPRTTSTPALRMRILTFHSRWLHVWGRWKAHERVGLDHMRGHKTRKSSLIAHASCRRQDLRCRAGLNDSACVSQKNNRIHDRHDYTESRHSARDEKGNSPRPSEKQFNVNDAHIGTYQN